MSSIAPAGAQEEPKGRESGERAASGNGAKRRPRHPEAVLLALAVAALVAGTWVYVAQRAADVDLVKLQWAADLPAGALNAMRPGSADLRAAVDWDMRALIPGYLAGLALACWAGRRVFWTARARAWALAGVAAAALAGAANYAQDLLLLRSLGAGLPAGALPDWVEALSFAKFAALLVAGSVGLAAVMVTTGRLVMSGRDRKRWDRALADWEKRHPADSGEAPGPKLVIPPPDIERPGGDGRAPASLPVEGREWWDQYQPTGPRARWAEGYAAPANPPAGEVGVCVSGGGIRSAAVALGALCALREKGVLGQARYLVSVSGGGYTVGGLQLAMTKEADREPDEPLASLASAADAFAPGSPEEDYLRRHSSYLADTLAQWLAALGVLLRGVLGSLLVIGLTVTTAGLATGAFYRRVPITAGGDLPLPKFAVTSGNAPAFPAVPVGVWSVIAVAAGLTLAAYLVRQLVAGQRGGGRWWRRSALVMLAVTALLAGLGVALPALLWFSSWITWKLGFSYQPAAAGTLTVVTMYLGAVAATFWRKRTTVAKAAGTVTGAAGKGPVTQVLPNSMIQLILLWICLGFLILVALLCAGWAATSPLAQSLWALAPAGALVLLAALVDQTSLSLHPFYRRHLARAFAVRRVSGDHADVAEPYQDSEATWLDTYARPVPGFPAVTFAATANITGQDRTPPGRRAVPFMLAHDYIGGPATGWVRTDFLRQLLPGALRDDLTTEAATAISGAAFASAMGSQTRFYQVFLALANARLGAWLPNPGYVALKVAHPGDWTIPGFPARRRLSYFAREVLGIHPSAGRLLLCTDGGHYDNLGLVELLRRRCRLIYCIDASGASRPLADALAGAITLAREELGAEITLTGQAFELVAGDREQLKPDQSFTDLNARLSTSPVTLGSVTYPPVAGHQEAHGQLVFVQTVLTPDMPYQLLDFPQGNPGFPHDSTGDQFFNAAQFDAYQALGYFLGQQAADRAPGIPVTVRRRPSPAAS